MASRNLVLPLDSHVQSHAEVLKNKLCEFPAPLEARAMRSLAACRKSQLTRAG
jgi:hypothetical protein